MYGEEESFSKALRWQSKTDQDLLDRVVTTVQPTKLATFSAPLYAEILIGFLGRGRDLLSKKYLQRQDKEPPSSLCR